MSLIDKILKHYKAENLVAFLFPLAVVLFGALFGEVGLGIALGFDVIFFILREVIGSRREGYEFNSTRFSWGMCGSIMGVILYVISLI